MAPPRIIVVGAGIVGLATARALMAAGAHVSVIEKGPIPCPTAASSDHHRLIRHSYPDHPGYARRIDAAFAAWERLFDVLPRERAHYYAERGILTLSRAPGDYGDRTRALFEAEGIKHRRFDGSAALAAAFPVLKPGGAASGTLSRGGALMANRIIADLADHLRLRGAVMMEHARVVEIEAASGRVRLADGRMLSADTVVAAAGTGLPHLMPGPAGDLVFRRTVVVYAHPPAHLASAWAAAPCWTDLGGEDDLWGMPPMGGLPAKLGCGAMGRADAADEDRTVDRTEMTALMARYGGAFRDLDRFTLSHGQANYWMLAPGARFRLAREGRAVAVSACSGHGFKFGALTGEDVAEAVLWPSRQGEVAERLAAEDGTSPAAGRDALA